MSDIPSLLQPLKDRLAAATPGPWHARTVTSGRFEGVEARVVDLRGAHILLGPADGQAGQARESDATFIASAPTDQAKLIAAIEAVVGLHKPVAGHNPACECGIPAGAGASCEECQDAWPCPTVAALTQALGGETA